MKSSDNMQLRYSLSAVYLLIASSGPLAMQNNSASILVFLYAISLMSPHQELDVQLQYVGAQCIAGRALASLWYRSGTRDLENVVLEKR